MKGPTSICFLIILTLGTVLLPGLKKSCANSSKANFKSWANHQSGSKTDRIEITRLLNEFLSSEKDPEKIIDAAFYIKTNNTFGDTLSEIGTNFLLQNATFNIEELNYNSNPMKAIAYRYQAKRLRMQGVPVNIPLSNFQKVAINLKQKNYHYLLNRAQLEVKSLFFNVGSKYKVLPFGFLLLAIVTIWFLVKRGKYVQSGLLVFFCLGIGLLMSLSQTNSIHQKKPFEYSFYHLKLENNREIGASLILNNRQFPIGKLVWANEKAVDFNYFFSPNKLSFEVDSLKQLKHLLLNTTASYIDNNIDPVGFTSLRGKILNPLLNYRWGALVSISSNKLQLVPLNGEKLFANFESYFNLVSLVKKMQSDAFQVPLLVYNDSLLIDHEKARYNLRENRYLIKVTTPEKKCLFLIADIENPEYFTNNVCALFQSLQKQHYFINFMVLLDVGANNLFHVYNSDKTKNNNFRSMLPIEKATNILAITLKNEFTYSINP